MKMKALALLLNVLSTILLYANNEEGKGTVAGKVTTADGNPAISVTIALKNTRYSSLTDENGYFIMNNIPVGNYRIEVSLVGHETVTMDVLVENKQTTNVLIRLLLSDKELDEVIVQGVKKEYKVNQPSSSLRLQSSLLETPQNIQVVTNAVIRDQQIYDMLEGVTRNVSGVSRTEHWDNYARITARGSQIAAFRNGMNVAMPWGPLTEDMSIVDRIEFVKGPAGFMLASGEPSGFYNVVTKKPTGITKGEATLSLGSFDTYRASLDLDGKLDKEGNLLYRFNVMGMLKGSHRQYDYNNRYTFAPVITYKINDQTSVTAEYTFQFSQTPLLGSAYVYSAEGYESVPRDFSLLEPNMPPTRIKDHSAFLTLHHQINGNWNFTAQLGYLTFNQLGSSTWPLSIFDEDWNELEPAVYANGDIRRGINIWDAWGQNKLGQAFVNGKIITGRVTHKILAGIDMGNKQYMGDWGQGYVLNGPGDLFNIYNPQYGQVPADVIMAYDRSKSLRQRAGSTLNYENYNGVYAQDELGFLDNKIRLTLAARYTTLKLFDGYSPETDDSKFTPRAGISVSVDKQTAVYGLFDQSFIPQSGIIYGGGKIKPLEGNNIEFGIKRDWFGSSWNTTLSVYQITKRNAMTADPDPAHTPVGIYSIQIGKMRVKGVEFDLRGEIIPGLNATLNYAYTDQEVLENGGNPGLGSSIDAYAKHLTNAWLAYHSKKGLGISLGYQYQIDRVAGDWGGLNPKNRSLPDYFRMDGAITWQNNKMNIGLNVNNILNAYLYNGAPYDTYYYWQSEPGTNFRLSVGFKF